MTTYYITDQFNSIIRNEADSGSLAAENADVADHAKTTNFILCGQCGYSNSGACNRAVAATSLKLQFNKDGGGTWYDVGAATEIAYADVSGLTNDSTAGTARCSSTPTGCTGAASVKDCEDGAVTSTALAAEAWQELKFGLSPANAVAGVKYAFRLYNITSSVAVTGTNANWLAEVTIAIETGDTYNESINEKMSLVERPAPNMIYTMALREIASALDSQSHGMVHWFTFTEIVSLADALTIVRVFNEFINETLSLAEPIRGPETPIYNETISEKVSLLDLRSASLRYLMSISEQASLGVSEGPQGIYHLKRDDVSSLLDTLRTSFLFSMVFRESASLRDIMVDRYSFSLPIVESLSASDILKGQFTFQPVITEKLSLVEAIAAGLLFNLPMREISSLTDSMIIQLIGGEAIWNESLTDRMSIGDVLQAALKFYASVRDTASIVDRAVVSVIAGISMREAMSMGDREIASILLNVPVSELSSFSDDMIIDLVGGAQTFNESLVEKLSSQDTLQAILMAYGQVRENVSLVDAVKLMSLFGMTVREFMSAAGSSAESLRTFFGSLTEKLSLSDRVAALFIHAIGMSEIASMRDAEKASLAINIRVDDRAQLTDTLSAIFRFGLTITDNLSAGDIVIGTAIPGTIRIVRGRTFIFTVDLNKTTADIALKKGAPDISKFH